MREFYSVTFKANAKREFVPILLVFTGLYFEKK